MLEAFAQGYSEPLSRPHADRTVPQAIDTPLPHCRKLNKALQGSG